MVDHIQHIDLALVGINVGVFFGGVCAFACVCACLCRTCNRMHDMHRWVPKKAEAETTQLTSI